MDRASGILLPISALPSPYGIGTLGKAAYAFADFLHAAGQRYWQLLPLGPTSYGDSPYQSFSTFAGNPYFIDLDLLAEEGLLDKEDLAAADWGNDPRYVDYGKIYEVRFDVLRRAFLRGRERDREAVERFQAENPWLKNYALYMAVKAHFGMKSWLEWPDEPSGSGLRRRWPGMRRSWRRMWRFYTYLQYLFFKQWGELREYIHSLGIRIIGDLPIYVAMDSADVWAEPEFFQLGEGNIPTEVSGVPPDYFSADGQLWGNPLYDYDRMRQDGFGWWIRRVEGASRLFDVIRIDHFRGLESYWAVPYGAETAREGRWRKGPGMDLVGGPHPVVPRPGHHRRGPGLPDAGGPPAPEGFGPPRHEGAGVRLRRPGAQQLPAPHLRAQLRVLRGHPRQRDRDAVAGSRRTGPT